LAYLIVVMFTAVYYYHTDINISLSVKTCICLDSIIKSTPVNNFDLSGLLARHKYSRLKINLYFVEINEPTDDVGYRVSALVDHDGQNVRDSSTLKFRPVCNKINTGNVTLPIWVSEWKLKREGNTQTNEGTIR
jgi:hypothetical protein